MPEQPSPKLASSCFAKRDAISLPQRPARTRCLQASCGCGSGEGREAAPAGTGATASPASPANPLHPLQTAQPHGPGVVSKVTGVSGRRVRDPWSSEPRTGRSPSPVRWLHVMNTSPSSIVGTSPKVNAAPGAGAPPVWRLRRALPVPLLVLLPPLLLPASMLTLFRAPWLSVAPRQAHAACGRPPVASCCGATCVCTSMSSGSLRHAKGMKAGSAYAARSPGKLRSRLCGAVFSRIVAPGQVGRAVEAMGWNAVPGERDMCIRSC